ncbi:hypothetical protein AB0B50_38970 [Streptomyces sp. NPDC041068]|uniref:hypothetical protein n=1 Tax=Streptomyces sp. NPDC041068 TaxID=3155130 RepID=UPI0033EC55F0
MQMTEGFVTTAASVAAGVLIAATIEVAAYGRAVQQWLQLHLEVLDRAERMKEASQLSREERIELFSSTARLLPRWSSGMLRSIASWTAGMWWGTVMVLQAVAIGMCLLWLGDPKHPASPEQAEYVAAFVTAGAATVALFPMWRFLGVPFGSLYAHIEDLAAKEMERRIVEQVHRAGHGDT